MQHRTALHVLRVRDGNTCADCHHTFTERRLPNVVRAVKADGWDIHNLLLCCEACAQRRNQQHQKVS